MPVNPRIGPIERTTGRTWDEWLRFLDAIGARDLDHGAIALRVYEELGDVFEQRGWWTQSVTVAYEHHIGRRVPGQRSDGTFQTSVSRATPLPMTELMARWRAFADGDAAVQEVVAGGTPRVSGTDRRTTWRTRAVDGSSVVVTSEPKRNGTASLVATQVGLPTPEANEAARERWTGIVARFLAGVAPGR
ncbi:hypothetical protein SAMN05660464_0706 [Geodermatophilus dictyosporus]|uniref:DUF4287 domain-containing protein n=1 Tax=Geodermatophilus dictyosporus TaxID=1523247 RepID=A0A1I5JFG8_9ACTN|nr:hypothetical protein [Geodermatophilus dictyosporus]SFO71537.1 hypothetical protein SAMN05660464_0706 [Geodermatophilus dictyosporus]